MVRSLALRTIVAAPLPFGASAGPAARRRAEARLAAEEVEIEVHLAAGRASDRVLTCDLTYDYVRINAEYTT